MEELYTSCKLCPRKCAINRRIRTGVCGSSNTVKVARASLHYFEEPSISGVNGSGTIFFSGCNLKCCYCQNKDISWENFGREITVERLADIMLELQSKKAHNINLVTPTHFVPSIIEAIKLAKEKGLNIPIIYNTSGYEDVWTLKLLAPYIDIYLTDFKYFSNDLGKKFSKCSNYFNITSKALDEMYRQTGKNEFNKDGLMTKGILVRCLILPTLSDDTKKIIEYVYKKYQDNVYLSIMNQYTPVTYNKDYPFLNQTLSATEYDEVVDYALDLGVKNAYIQEGETCSESFIPPFDLEGV